MSSLPLRSSDEETINAYTHLLWAVLSSVFAVILLIDPDVTFKFKVATIMMTGLSGWTFISSFLYHSSTNRKKVQNREVDKASIFLMITGCGVSLNMTCVDPLMATISCSILILAGTFLTFVYTHKESASEVFSVTSYVLLGWFCALPLTGLIGDSLYNISSNAWLVVAGGISYSIGVLFYAKDSVKWNHTWWHVFVMLGYGFHIAGHYYVVQYASIA